MLAHEPLALAESGGSKRNKNQCKWCGQERSDNTVCVYFCCGRKGRRPLALIV